MSQIPADKHVLRAQMRAQRRALSAQARQRAALRVAEHFLRSRKLVAARRVALYLAHGAELDPLPLTRTLLHAGRRVFVPRIHPTRPMRLVQLRHTSCLRRGRHGIETPAGHSARSRLRQLDLILLPLVAFDDRGRRLGSGGGSYDRLLAHRRVFRRPLAVGYAFETQRLPRLPEEPWDQRLDAVITERGIRWFKAGMT